MNATESLGEDRKIGLRKSFFFIFGMLLSRERKRYLIELFIGVLLALTDLIGLLFLSIILTKLANTMPETHPLSGISFLLDAFILRINNFNVTQLILLVSAFFIVKSLLNLIFQSNFHKSLAITSERIARFEIYRYLKVRPMLSVYSSTQDVIRYLNFSLPSIMIGGLSAALVLIIDFFLSITILLVALFISTPLLVFFVFYFSIVFALMNSFNGKIALSSSQNMLKSEIDTNEQASFVLKDLRLLNAKGSLDFYIQKLMHIRTRGYQSTGNFMFTLLIPKYVIEASLILGLVLFILLCETLGFSDSRTLELVALFVVLGARIAPSALRIQFYLAMFKKISHEVKFSQSYLGEVEKLEGKIPLNLQEHKVSNDLSIKASPHLVDLSEVHFKHPTRNVEVLSSINLTIDEGETVAILGLNGSGKSTVLDLISGFQFPNSGSVHIAGLPPKDYILRNPGRMSYLAQDISFVSGSVYENVAPGIEPHSINREHVEFLLANLEIDEELLRGLLEKNIELSEFGKNLSGGQRQKIGIARALYSQPRLLLLDEASSAIDSSSEKKVMNFVLEQMCAGTVISIAHRRNAISGFKRFSMLTDVGFLNYEDLERCLAENSNLNLT